VLRFIGGHSPFGRGQRCGYSPQPRLPDSRSERMSRSLSASPRGKLPTWVTRMRSSLFRTGSSSRRDRSCPCLLI
jgi:hypothetical protein